jgi:hypothetical protein
MKVCFTNRKDWDDKVLVVLWDYTKNTKKLHKFTPFDLVYEKEVMVSAKFISPSLYIT